MTVFHLTIAPRDPVIARDGRPFSAGSRMKSLDWLYPSVLAGSLRTLLGKATGGAFTDAERQALRGLAIAGPFPVLAGQLCFPAPRDLVLREDDRCCFTARPSGPSQDEGTDLPHALAPAMLDTPPEQGDFKPGPIPAFWSQDRLAAWLCNRTGAGFEVSGHGFYRAPLQDERMHVQLTAEKGTAEDAMLYSSTGLDLACLPDGEGAVNPRLDDFQVTLAAQVASAGPYAAELQAVLELAPLGGERRVAHWQTAAASPAQQAWTCPSETVQAALQAESQRPPDSQRVRLVLATPAVFPTGWYPEWLHAADETKALEGEIPQSGVRVRLAGACLDRWRPLSGWSLEPLANTHRPGPKAVRRAVPAGSVYFFDVLAGDPGQLAGRWLKSVCEQGDDGQAARDGFGLALWGVWGRPAPR